MKLNKKGHQMIAYSFIVTMLILFFMAYVHVASKTSRLSSKTGELQSGFIKILNKKEEALIFVDQAGKYAVSDSVRVLGKKGFYFDEPLYHSDGPERYV